MSLYAIGDLHLHFQSELKARNQIEDKIWHKINNSLKFPTPPEAAEAGFQLRNLLC